MPIWVLAQHATTQIGIGYMRNGGVQTVQPLTSDHQLAAKAMRLPTGMPGISASPYLALAELSATNLGTQLADLKKFVLAQHATTQIGIGYMRNGGVQTVQPLTSDHQLAAKAMRLPTGMPGISASPYLALAELIHKW